MLEIDHAQWRDTYDLVIRYDCRGFDFLTAYDRSGGSEPTLVQDGPESAIVDATIRISDDPGTAADDGVDGSFSLWGGAFTDVGVPTPSSACSGEKSLTVSLSGAADTLFLMWAAQVSDVASGGAAPLRLAVQVRGGEEIGLEIDIESPGPAQFMPMPVQGAWRVTCGYRCGLHDDEHLSTFAIDMVLANGDTAGQSVQSPVGGRVIAVTDSSTAICGGKSIEGPEAGAAFVIEFQALAGTAQRLRLVHIDPASVPSGLRPVGGPVPVDAGTVLGSLADMGSCSHLHINLTRLEERREIPEPLTMEDILLGDCGGENCWHDALLPPQEQ
jgi:hypothetical protein